MICSAAAWNSVCDYWSKEAERKKLCCKNIKDEVSCAESRIGKSSAHALAATIVARCAWLGLVKLGLTRSLAILLKRLARASKSTSDPPLPMGVYRLIALRDERNPKKLRHIWMLAICLSSYQTTFEHPGNKVRNCDGARKDHKITELDSTVGWPAGSVCLCIILTVSWNQYRRPFLAPLSHAVCSRVFPYDLWNSSLTGS